MSQDNNRVYIPRVGTKKQKEKAYLDEVRITNVQIEVRQQLKNIASHLGINVSAMLKPKLKEIINSYPEHYRTTFKD